MTAKAKTAKVLKDTAAQTKKIVKEGTEEAKIMVKSSVREMVPFFLLIGSWIWFFSAQSAEIKLNSKSIDQLSVAVRDISAIVTEYRIKSSSTDERLKSIDSNLSDIKNKLNQ